MITEKGKETLLGDKNVQSNFPSLTGLRFLLALVIVYFHTRALIGAAEPSALGAFLRNYGGLIGNQTFFTLSGFLIAYHYLDMLWSGKKDFPSFLKGRLVKLYPLYFLGALECILFDLVANGFTNVNFEAVSLNLLMMATGWFRDVYRFNSPLWFFGVVVLCYMVFFMVCYLARKNRRIILYVSVALSIWGYVLMTNAWTLPFMSHWTGEGLHSFFLGVLLCEAYKVLQHRTMKGLCIAGGVAVVFVAFLGCVFGFSEIAGSGYLWVTLLLSPMLVIGSIEIPPLRAILGNRFMENLGKMSMSIIVWHMPVFDVLYWVLYQRGYFLNGHSHWVRLAIYMTVLLIGSRISYQIIEKKLGTVLKKKLLLK